MFRYIGILILSVEIFALSNRGGGPLLSHLFLTGITFLCCVIWFFKNSHKKELRFGWPHVFYWGFFFFFFLSLFTSRTPEFGLSELLLFANGGLLFLLISNVEDNKMPSNMALFSISLIVIATISTLIGYFFYINLPFPRFAATFLDLKEPHTSFGNDFANFLILILPLCIWHLTQKYERRTTVVIFVFCTAILLSGFILTFSRAAWLSAFTIAIIALSWLAFQKKINAIVTYCFFLRFAAVILLTVILISGLQYSRSQNFETIPILKKLTFQADEGTASASERLEFWKGAIRIIKDRPLLGNGVLSFRYLYPQYQAKFGITWDHPHNMILKIAVENGIVATIFFIAFLISLFLIIIRFLWKNTFHPVFYLSLGALAAFIHNLLDFNFIVSNFTLFMVYGGIGLSYTDWKGYAPKTLRPLSRLFLAFLILLSLHEGFYNISFKKGRAKLVAGNIEQAIPLLARAGNLLFPRDQALYLATAYGKKYNVTKDTAWREKKEEILRNIIKYQTIEASVYNELGEIELEKNNYTTARDLFSRAVHIDPSNRFRYYYNLFTTDGKLHIQHDSIFQKRLFRFLEDYEKILAGNKHVTILTDNPQYAARLYEYFGIEQKKELIERLSKYGAQKMISW